MKYYLRTKADALGDGTRVLDHKRRVLYSLKKGAGPRGEGALLLKDGRGKELAIIEEVPVAVGPLYEIHRPKQPDVSVTQKLFSFQASKFIIDVPGMDDLETRGDFQKPDYQIWRAGRKVGEVEAKKVKTGRVVELELDESQDQILLMSAAMAIALAALYDD